jgi:hypothetical protein
MTIENGAPRRGDGQRSQPLIDSLLMIVIAVDYLNVIETNNTDAE